jgi:hypothetical protein
MDFIYKLNYLLAIPQTNSITEFSHKSMFTLPEGIQV